MVSVISIVLISASKKKLRFDFYCLKTIGSADWVVVVVMVRGG